MISLKEYLNEHSLTEGILDMEDNLGKDYIKQSVKDWIKKNIQKNNGRFKINNINDYFVVEYTGNALTINMIDCPEYIKFKISVNQLWISNTCDEFLSKFIDSQITEIYIQKVNNKHIGDPSGIKVKNICFTNGLGDLTDFTDLSELKEFQLSIKIQGGEILDFNGLKLSKLLIYTDNRRTILKIKIKGNYTANIVHTDAIIDNPPCI